MQDVYWGVLLGSTHVEGKGRRQGWEKGEVELRYIVSTEASAGHTGSWSAPQSCLKLSRGARHLYLPYRSAFRLGLLWEEAWLWARELCPQR